MGAGGYESWFVSARDPVSPRALWIRHTRHRPRVGPESVALWCTVIDRDGGQQPAVVKEVFAAFPPGTAAGPGRFRGQAAMAGHHARWDLAVTGEQAPLRPLRPGGAVPCAAAAHQARGGRPGRTGHRHSRSRRPQVACPGGGARSVTTGDPSTPTRGSGCTPRASAPHRRRGWNWCWPGSGSARPGRRGPRWARSASAGSGSCSAGWAGGRGRRPPGRARRRHPRAARPAAGSRGH